MPQQPEDYLRVILATPGYYSIFYEYAKTKHCEENLDFLTAVKGYRKHTHKKTAIRIIDQFVESGYGGFMQGGPVPVNLNDGTVLDLRAKRDDYITMRQNAKRMNFFKRHWSSGNRQAAEGLFNEAEAFIFNLVLNDTYAKFAQTPQGQAIEEAIDKRTTKNKTTLDMMDLCFQPAN
jgi:hypothetical protein